MDQRALVPTAEQTQPLGRFERFAFGLAHRLNVSPFAKAAQHSFLRTAGAGWVYYFSRYLTHVLGLDAVRELQPRRGLLFASNHRSFFDQFVIAGWLFRTTPLLKRIYFPVRASFFYEHPLGVAVNTIASGMAMYPPVFRQAERRAFNNYSLRRVVQLLQQPGTVVGVHPEGTRNKGDDPYALLKAQPGIGKMILEARPTVLPIFINGLSNDFAGQVKGNFSKKGSPIVIVLGKPIDGEAFEGKSQLLRSQKNAADRVVAEIVKLGQIERAYRASLLASERPRGPVLLGEHQAISKADVPQRAAS